jgi:hypothetical protein
MGKTHLVLVVVCLIAVHVARPPRASAQIYEAVGTRAQGMGGAFVAVANDASATWWNPAALILSYFSVVVDRAVTEEPADPSGVWRATTGGVAASFPSLGLSYYRLRVSEIAAPASTAGGDPGRQDLGAAGIGLRSRYTQQFGATIGQSLGNHVVIASTLKLVRAGESAAPPGTLDEADELEPSLDSSGDLDIGALVMVASARIGVSVKHVNEPEFGEGSGRFVLGRQVRAGFAWVAGQTGAPVIVTAAFDADLTRTPTAFGEARHIASGVEVELPRQRLAVRGGVSANTVGDTGSSVSGGVSLGLVRGFYLDAARTFGSDRSRKGWAASFRLTI